jgi:hypothetical protein
MAIDEEKGSVNVHYITGFGELASLIAGVEAGDIMILERQEASDGFV